MGYVPGFRAATALCALGLTNEGIIRGLMAEIGLTHDEAARAAAIAESEYADANRGRAVRSCARGRRRSEPPRRCEN